MIGKHKDIAMRVFYLFLVSFTYVFFVNSTPQGPETNDQLDDNHTESKTSNTQAETNSILDENKDIHAENSVIDDNSLSPDVPEHENQTELNKPEINHSENQSEIKDTALQITTKLETTGFITKFYIAVRKPIVEFIEEPRVSIILKNIGTCIVNGAMEIISYYFPAPLIPLIASAAGTMIPFEPVVMLRKRMPVTSYRRAFNKAVNSFMGTFDRFKTSEEDPYMTRRFNRRFMQDNSMQDKN